MENEGVINARNAIIADGFKLYKKCKCTGVLTEKYILGIWRINILPNRQTFFIIRNGKALIGKSIEKFNEVYNEYKAEIFEVV